MHIPLQKGNTRLEPCSVKVCDVNQLKYLNILKHRCEFIICFPKNKRHI